MPLPASDPLHGSGRFETAALGASRILTVHASLPDVVRELVGWAGVAVPSSACSLLVRTDGAEDLVHATGSVVGVITADAVARLSSPLAEALDGTRTLDVGRAHTDPRWPAFGRRAGGVSLRSLVSTGVVVDDRTAAVLTHWSTDADAFDPVDVAGVEAFAAFAAPVLRNAIAAGDLLRRHDHLTQALTSRAVIDQAIGIVMSRTGSSADQALGRLRTISQREHVKVHEVAQRTVRDAVNRTRARMLQSNGPAAVVTPGAVAS